MAGEMQSALPPIMPAAPGSVTSRLPLGDKPFASPYFSVGIEICQNMYLEASQSTNGKSEYYLIKIPGLRRLSSTLVITNTGACRGMFTASNGRTFSVHGTGWYELFEDGSKTLRGVLGSHQGPVSMAENGQLLMLVDGVDGWILRYTDSNVTRITDTNFPGQDGGNPAPTFVTYLNTYFIVNIPNTNQYYWSNNYYTWDDVANDIYGQPYDPAHADGYWTPLQSGQKTGKPDNITSLINCNNYLWLPGYNSTEVHYDSGDTTQQQFKRYQGALINVGCRAPYSVAVIQNNIFFLGSDNSGTLGVFSNNGMNPVRISTRGIEQRIQEMDTYSDCQGYCYAQNGHNFYVMQFPSAQKTYVYDTATNAWHERTKLNAVDGSYIAWDGMYATSNWDRVIVGDLKTSEIYESDATYYQNDNPLSNGVNYIRCVKTTPIDFRDGSNVRYNWAQVVCSQGTGLSVDTPAGVGLDPKVQLAWSNDTGVTWSNERSAPLGRQGEYSKRSIVLAGGMGRNRVWRIAMTDPVPFILVVLLVNSSKCRF